MKRKQFLACVLAMGVTLSPAGINAMVANAQEVTAQTNQASQTTNILVNNIVLDGVDAPSDGKLLDFSAAAMLNGSSKWNMDIVWVDEAGRKATNWSASNKSYPVFYINPAGFTLKRDFNVESDIQLSDVVKSIYGDKKLEKIVDEKTGRIFMTCEDGPCKGKDKKILAAICSAEIQNRCELEKERRNPTIYIKLDDKDDKKETDVKDEVVSTDNKPTDTTTTETTTTDTSTAPTDTTQNGTDTSDENNQQKDDEQQGGNNQQDDNSQQGDDNQQGDNNQTLSVEDMIKADQGKLTPEALAVELANQPGESDVISAINDKIKEITGLNYEWTVSEINFEPVYSDEASDEDIRVVLKSGNVEYEIEFVHVDIAAASTGSNDDISQNEDNKQGKIDGDKSQIESNLSFNISIPFGASNDAIKDIVQNAINQLDGLNYNDWKVTEANYYETDEKEGVKIKLKSEKADASDCSLDIVCGSTEVDSNIVPDSVTLFPEIKENERSYPIEISNIGEIYNSPCSAEVTPKGASGKLVWQIDDNDVAVLIKDEVTGQQYIKGVGPGRTTIRAISKGDESIYGEYPILVKGVKIGYESIDGIIYPESVRLSRYVIFGDNDKRTFHPELYGLPAGSKVNWTCDSNRIKLIENGTNDITIEAVDSTPQPAIVTCTVEGTSYYAEIEVNVINELF